MTDRKEFEAPCKHPKDRIYNGVCQTCGFNVGEPPLPLALLRDHAARHGYVLTPSTSAEPAAEIEVPRDLLQAWRIPPLTNVDAIFADKAANYGYRLGLMGSEPAVAQREPIPESVMRALEFYSATTFSQLNLKTPKSRQLSKELKESPDWEYIGETYHGDDQFVATTRLAEIAKDELREWLEAHNAPDPQPAKDVVPDAAQGGEQGEVALNAASNYAAYIEANFAGNPVRQKAP